MSNWHASSFFQSPSRTGRCAPESATVDLSGNLSVVRANPARKHLVAVASLIAHAALFALLLGLSPDPPAGAEIGAMTVSLMPGDAFAATSPQAPAKAKAKAAPPAAVVKAIETPPPPQTDIEPQYIDVPVPGSELAERDPLNDPVALSVSTAATNTSGEVCQLSEWLQQALQADPQVQAALLGVPRPARSVANALMLWDGEWIEPRMQAGQSVAAIRAALMAGIRAAPQACQTEPVRGPELLSLTEGAGVTILAVGSGEWRWVDLLEPSLPVAVDPANRPSR